MKTFSVYLTTGNVWGIMRRKQRAIVKETRETEHKHKNDLSYLFLLHQTGGGEMGGKEGE